MLIKNLYICRKNRWRFVLAGLLVLGAGLPGVVHAQALRLGPVDFEVATSLKGVYTTNVEGERPSEATESREDYYFVAALDLQGDTKFGRSTKVSLDTGISIERHVKRPDLDDSNDPFGRFKLGTSTKFKHSTITVDIDLERRSESKAGVYDPGSRKKRAPHNDFSYGVGWVWDWKTLKANAGYSFEHVRYDDEEFKEDGDKDTTTIDFGASWYVTKRLSLEYTYQRKLDDYKYAWEEDDGWEVKSFAGVRYDLLLKPYLSAYVGYTKDSEESGTEEWYPTIGADFSATILDTERWKFDVDAEWKHVDEIPNDSKLTYSATLENQISRTAVQTLKATQEPVETLGSNKDTDTTRVEYTLKKTDLFIYNLNFDAGVSWEQDKPVEDEDSTSEGESTEYIWRYHTGLNYIRAITRKLRRELRYTYTCEDSNKYDELLDEHRVELEFIYTF